MTGNPNPRFADFEQHLVCRCGHLGGQHKRGWGPCTYVDSQMIVVDRGGTRWSGRVSGACECRRFIGSNHPAGKGRP